MSLFAFDRLVRVFIVRPPYARNVDQLIESVSRSRTEYVLFQSTHDAIRHWISPAIVVVSLLRNCSGPWMFAR
jgi:hypothetical protein